MSKLNSSDDKSQLDKFKETARDLECDDDEGRFAQRLGRLLKPETVEKPRPTEKKDSHSAD